MSKDIFGPSPKYQGLPFIILKLVGLAPSQVAAIEEAVRHPAWDEKIDFFKINAREEFQSEPEHTSCQRPVILRCARNEKHATYTMEIQIPIFLLSVFCEDRLFKDKEHRNLLPITVLQSIFDAAGIFPDKTTAIDPYETHGDLKHTAPLLVEKARGRGTQETGI